MKPLSIIIPHKNDINNLKRCLKSIPNTNEIEIIVVDDHSDQFIKEEVKEVCKNVGNARLIENLTNVYSAGKARNMGIEVSTGEWIIFSDSDDYFVDGWWENIRNCVDGGYELVFFKTISQIENTDQESNRHFIHNELVEDYLVDKNSTNELRLRVLTKPPWGKAIKRTLIIDNDLKFLETRVAEDARFSLLCGLKASKIKVINNIIYNITEREGSLSNDQSEVYLLETFNEWVYNQLILRNTLAKKEYRSCCSSTLKWFQRGITSKMGLGYYKILTIKLIKYRLPIISVSLRKRLLSKIK
ncbi:MAG: glycosyltransferase family 2 protein [Turicibacter sp.]|nr:glycosyltransferase family 2 protein [Turicibacter sp.]